VETPSHASATSQAPAAGRQTAPVLPAGWVHAPLPSQTSAVHALPSGVHDVPFVLKASAGQADDVPVHVSATSHSPVAARHTVPADTRASVGQVLDVPLHVSATSQAPADGRHTAVLLASAGQAGPVPVQDSGRSQAPALARHVTIGGWKLSGGQ